MQSVSFGELFLDGKQKKKLNSVAKTKGSLDDILDSVRVLFPTMIVSIPDLGNSNLEDWEGDNNLKVAYLPEGLAKDIDFMPAFDKDGNMTKLDAVNPPDELVIVVSNDHTLYTVSNDDLKTALNNCYQEVRPVFQDESYSYFDGQAIDDCSGIGAGSGGGSGGSSGGNNGSDSGSDFNSDDTFNDPSECPPTVYRWRKNGEEYIKSFRYNTIGEFRDVHGWSGKTKRHRLNLIRTVWGESEANVISRTFRPTRGDLRYLNAFGPNGVRWYEFTLPLKFGTWHYRKHGDTWLFDWTVIGSGDVTERTVGISSGFKAKLLGFLEVNRTLTLQKKVTSTDSDRFLGNKEIDFCHETQESVDGRVYTIGALRFHYFQENN